jgi:hypothetical protein
MSGLFNHEVAKARSREAGLAADDVCAQADRAQFGGNLRHFAASSLSISA